ncbi:MAG: hypothetical protein ACE5QW_09650 [Thermoplasmata archaeon]
MKSRHLALVVLVASVLAVVQPQNVTADEGEISETSVHFGLSPMEIVTGITYELSCKVNVVSSDIELKSGESEIASYGVTPGPCSMELEILGIPVALPLYNSTPLGVFSYYIPGVSGIAFGLVDVSIDLITSLRGALDPSSVAPLQISENSLTWNVWGSRQVNINLPSSLTGGKETKNLVMNLDYEISLGVSVWFLGSRLMGFDLMDIGTIPGTPQITNHVTADYKPTAIAFAGDLIATFEEITLRWTKNLDSDFAYYEITQIHQSLEMSFKIADSDIVTANIPAKPLQSYEVEVRVYDSAMQYSSTDLRAVTTPDYPIPEPVVLSSPQNLTSTSVTFTWSKSTDSYFDRYVVELCKGPECHRFEIQNIERNSSVLPILSGRNYTAKVFVYNSFNRYSSSNERSFDVPERHEPSIEAGPADSLPIPITLLVLGFALGMISSFVIRRLRNRNEEEDTQTEERTEE